jgi:signal peptidase
MSTGLRAAASAIRLVWLAFTAALLTLMVLPHLLPVLDDHMLIVRGTSMQPAIQLGSVVVVGHVSPADIAVGDVITFRSPNGVVVTHRVLAISHAGDVSFSTKGDASTSADPVVVPATAVIGRVWLTVPGLGDFMAAVATTWGAVLTTGMLVSLLLVAWFFEELAATLGPASTRRTAVRPIN